MSIRVTVVLFVFLFVINLRHAYSDPHSVSIDWTRARSTQGFGSSSSDIIIQALEGMPLKIVFENINAFVIKCEISNLDLGTFFSCGCYFCNNVDSITQSSADKTQILYISQVTASMSTLWHCSAESIMMSQRISFEIKVKGSKSVTVKINDDLIFFKSSDLNDEGYDAIAYYETEEHRNIHVIISPPKDFMWPLHIGFYNEHDEKLNEYNAMALVPVEFNLVIYRSTSNSYIICTISSRRTQIKQTFTYKIVFTLKSSIYERNLSCTTSTSTTTKRYVEPTTEEIYTINNTVTTTPKRVPAEPPIIQGLLNGNILYQNNTNPETWEVIYLFRVNQTVNLTCSTLQHKRLQWVIEQKEKTLIELSTMNWYYITRTFTFQSKDNGTSIICQSKCEDDPTNIQKSIIRLHQIIDDDDFKLTTEQYTTTSTTTERYRYTTTKLDKNQTVQNNTTPGTEYNNMEQLAENNNKSNIIIACVAAIIVTALIVGLVVCCCRRNRTTANSQELRDNLVLEDDFRLQIPRPSEAVNVETCCEDLILEVAPGVPNDVRCPPIYDYAYDIVNGLRKGPCPRHYAPHGPQPQSSNTHSDESETHYYSVINQYFSHMRSATNT